MNLTSKIIRRVLAAVAVYIILCSQYVDDMAAPGDRIEPMIVAFLVPVAVVYLHWLLFRYVSAIDLLTKGEHRQLLEASDSGYKRGFLAQKASLGYLFVVIYSIEISGVSGHSKHVAPLAYLFVGIVFIFLGLAAFARGVVRSVIASHGESLPPKAQPGAA